MYDYRKMTLEQQQELVEYRRQHHRPWHSPPHWDYEGERQFLISAACFEHTHIIGATLERMAKCESDLLELHQQYCSEIYAWCLLPNHYHWLVKTDRITELLKELGKFHGRSSYFWNGEDGRRGRQVWHNSFERQIKSHRHFWASVNYVHNNPVHHGYVETWQDWPWSSAREFIERVGRERALEIWRAYPVLDYGKKWDMD
ncbi:MAG: transposase [Acidobacteria bacterium]|nr:transposase [Acidobacteriota bacterium]